MKNIHLIPTDKPSRLCLDREDILWFAPRAGFSIADGKQHIHITFDKEKIKEGDWVLSLTDDESYLEVYKYDGTTYLGEDKKIILTTDQELIKDGVQSIDDEFLEWFVKNPSCEVVEIRKEEIILGEVAGTTYIDFNYKIIIQQEEPNYMLKGGSDAAFPSSTTITFKPKQETLEEAAKSKAFEFKVDYKPFETDLDYGEYAEYGFEKGFIEGAKWQAERMYSEEEIHRIIESYQNTMENNPNNITYNQWFEQFKKK